MRDGAPATTGSAAALAPQISADGQLITFLSAANNLIAGQLEGSGTTDPSSANDTAGAETTVQ